MSVTFVWIMKDGMGIISSLLFTSILSPYLNSNVKVSIFRLKKYPKIGLGLLYHLLFFRCGGSQLIFSMILLFSWICFPHTSSLTSFMYPLYPQSSRLYVVWDFFLNVGLKKWDGFDTKTGNLNLYYDSFSFLFIWARNHC